MTDREYQELDMLLGYFENGSYDDPNMIKELIAAVRLLIMKSMDDREESKRLESEIERLDKRCNMIGGQAAQAALHTARY